MSTEKKVVRSPSKNFVESIIEEEGDEEFMSP
jgi:hypothetical protein